MAMITIEEMTVNYCNELQKFIGGLDLSFKSIPEISKILVELYEAKRTLKTLRKLNKTHEVIDRNTGKSVGELYDDEKIEAVMMSANITVNFWVEGCEGDIRRLTRKLII